MHFVLLVLHEFAVYIAERGYLCNEVIQQSGLSMAIKAGNLCLRMFGLLPRSDFTAYAGLLRMAVSAECGGTRHVERLDADDDHYPYAGQQNEDGKLRVCYDKRADSFSQSGNCCFEAHVFLHRKQNGIDVACGNSLLLYIVAIL